MILQFATFDLDTDRAELRQAGQAVAVEPKVFSLLCLLVENHDRVVTRDEMIARVWGGRFISDAAVATALKQVRKALGDDGDAQALLRTVRGRGHRFVAPVRIGAAGKVTAQVAEPPPSTDLSTTPDARGNRPTIAVLPFRCGSMPDDLATLGDAIPTEIISSLSRLRWLRVIARESTFRLRGDDVDLPGLHRVLGAGFCLTGRLEVSGRRLSVAVDLIDTRDGTLVWSERFERSLDQVHEVRAEIVTAVVSALDLQVPLAEAVRARQRPVEDLDAWGAYHLGLSHMYRFNALDNAIAEGLFRRATTLDPHFATAYAARSFTSFQNVMMGYRQDREAALAEARSEAETGYDLDPLDPYANAAMGRVHILTGSPDDGLVWLDRSVGLSPNYAKGHYSRAFLQVLRCETADTRSGIDLAIGLSPLDPLLPPMRIMQAYSHAIEGDHQTAARFAVEAARTGRGHLSALMTAVALCVLTGTHEEAQHWAKVVRAHRPDATIGLYLRSLPFARQHFVATLRAALRQAGFPD
jgi:TolB-like protein